MIQIRNSTKPAYLDSNSISECLARVKERVDNNESPAITRSDEKWRNEGVTDKLYESHIGKCCYCERRRDRKREMDVEHYRPKGEVEGDAAHNGYWWQAYVWDNLLWSCKTCNQKYKYMKFPLLAGGVRAENEDDDLSIEKPCLINPKLENPYDFISFNVQKIAGHCFITAIPLAGIDPEKRQRATDTIDIVGLNRDEEGYDLIQERGEAFLVSHFEAIVISILSAKNAMLIVPANREIYVDTLNELMQQLKLYIRPSRVFSGVFRDYLRHKEIDFDDLLDEIENEI